MRAAAFLGVNAGLALRKGLSRCVDSPRSSIESVKAPPATADLCDAFSNDNRVTCMASSGPFVDFGGRERFCGRAVTITCFEANTLVRQAVQSDGVGKVLVVDGGGSKRCALLGDNLALHAAKNGWAGVIVYGCIRDSEIVREIGIGVKALGTHPRKSNKRLVGEAGLPVSFEGLTICPGDFVYVDADGFVVAKEELKLH